MEILRLLLILPSYYISIITSLFHKAVSCLIKLKQFLNVASLIDLFLYLYFCFCGLWPCTVDLDEDTVVHVWIPTRRRFNKPYIVLIHGFGGNARWQWNRQIGSLCRSFNVYVPDLVFFGKSYTKQSDRSDVFQAKCMGEAMKALGLNKYSVFGISYGGYVAYRMADMYPEEVDKVMIMSCGICCTDEQQAKELKSYQSAVEILVPDKAEDVRRLMKWAFYRPPWAPLFVLKDFLDVMYISHKKEKVEMLQYLLTRKMDSDPLPVLNQDTLILWGDKDSVFPMFLAYQLERHLGQKSKVEIIKDAGHAANLESPHLVNDLVTLFLLGSTVHNTQR